MRTAGVRVVSAPVGPAGAVPGVLYGTATPGVLPTGSAETGPVCAQTGGTASTVH